MNMADLIEGAEMNEHTENDPRAELAALRERLDKLEAEHRELQRQALRARRPAFSRKFWLSALSASLLLAAVGALWGDEAMSLFVDPKGYVGIGTNDPKARLDVNGSARFSKIGINQDPFPGQKVIITADGTDIPLNVTNPANNVSWLVVSKDGNVFMNGGKVGIGTTAPGAPLQIGNRSEFKQDARIILSTAQGGGSTNAREWSVGVVYKKDDTTSPNYGFTIRDENAGTDRMVIDYNTGNVGIGTTAANAKLDVNGNAVVSGGLTVKGEIRGKPWTSQEYEWKYTRQVPTQMTKADHSVCFLTYAKDLRGWGESVEIKKNAAGYWALTGTSGPGVQTEARAMCVGVPD
jgi:hypothetical protein